MLCVVCGSSGILRHQLVLCENCIEDNNNLICKSDAMKNYALSNSDLEFVPFAYKQNACQAYSMLYLITDIENKAVEKYGSVKKVMDVLKSRQKKKELKSKKIRDKISERKSHLIKCFRAVELDNISLNLNDPASQDFIKGTKSVKAEDLAAKFKEQEFFSKYTNYKVVFNNLKSYTRGNMFGYTYDQLEELAKDEALKQYVIKNINDHRILELTVPKSLKQKTYEYSTKYYNNTDYPSDMESILDSIV